MITRKDLKNLNYLRNEIELTEKKIQNYKPSEIVADTVQASSPVFPYTQHTVIIEGLEHKEDKLTEYYRKLNNYKKQLEEEKKRIEIEIQKIPFSEIRLIIQYHYIENLSYVQIMQKMNYNAPETPRIKLDRFLKQK